VLIREGTVGDAGTEASGRVKGGPRVVDAGQMCDEEGQADSDGCDESGFVFFSRQHEYCEDKLCC